MASGAEKHRRCPLWFDIQDLKEGQKKIIYIDNAATTRQGFLSVGTDCRGGHRKIAC